MSEGNLDMPLAQDDHEGRRQLSPNKRQFAAELARKKHPERLVEDLDEARYSKEAADAADAESHFRLVSTTSQANSETAAPKKGRHLRPRKTMHGVELQIETLSPIGSRVLLYSWYAVLLVALIIQGIPTAQWGCQNICGDECDINHLEDMSSYECNGASIYNVTRPLNETANETITEQDVFWDGNGGELSRERLSRFALIVLVMPRPNATETGDLSFQLNFALSISNVSESVKLGEVIGAATLSCSSGKDFCDPIILSTNFAQAATNISSIAVVLQEVPQSIADVSSGAAVSFVSQIPRYTISTIVIRYAGMVGSLLHLVRFIAHKKYTDDLYEQTWVLILHLGLFLYLDPLFAAGVYIRPSPQFMQFLEYRVPLYFLAVFIAFMYSLITSAMHWSSSDVYHPPWKTKIIPIFFVAVVIALDLADASLSDWNWSAEHCPRFNCTVPGYLMYVTIGLGVLICTVWLRWLYNNLGKKPYLESRPQQLACRLFIFIFVTVVMYLIIQIIIVLAVYHKISALVSFQPLLQIGPIMVFIAFANILTFAYTTTVRSDKVPLKPTDPRWKRVYWETAWYQWLSLHGGSMYMFTNEIEEMLFYYIQEKHGRERQADAQRQLGSQRKGRKQKQKGAQSPGEQRPSYAHYIDRYGPTDATTASKTYGAIQGTPTGGDTNTAPSSPSRARFNDDGDENGPTPFEQKVREYEEELLRRKEHAKASAGEGFQFLDDEHEEGDDEDHASEDASASMEVDEDYDPQSYYRNQDEIRARQKAIDEGALPQITVGGSGDTTLKVEGGNRNRRSRRSSMRRASSRRSTHTTSAFLGDNGTTPPSGSSPNISPNTSRRVHMEDEEEEGHSRMNILPSMVNAGKSMGRFVRRTMVDVPAHLLDKVEDKFMDITAAALQLRRKPFFNLESCVDCFNLSWEAYGVKTSGGDMFVSTGIQIDLPDTDGIRKSFCCCGFGGGQAESDAESLPEVSTIIGDDKSPTSFSPAHVARNKTPRNEQHSGDVIQPGTAYNTGGASDTPPSHPAAGDEDSIPQKDRTTSGISNASVVSNPTVHPVVTTPPICVEQYGYELIAVFEALDVQVLITKMVCNVDRHDGKKPRIMISFRGTDNTSNAKQDLRIRRVTWTEMSTPSTNSYSAFVNWKTYNPPAVHGGFLEAWSALRGTVLTEVGDILLHQPVDAEPLKVYVTGHSLGGALAALCAYSLKRTLKIEAPIVYTFGQPRLGNKTFQTEYNKEIPETFRIVNESDVVSTITMFGGCHVGIEVGIDRNGNYISEPMFIEQFFRPTKGKGSAIVNHTMTAYGESINAIANSDVFGECPSRCLEPYVSEDKVMALASRRVYHELRYTEKQKGNYDPELYQHMYEPKRSNMSLPPA